MNLAPHAAAAMAARLKSARENASLTLDDVATMMMSPRDVLARMEKGFFAPAPHQCEALARIYGVSTAFLMSGDILAPSLPPTEITPLYSLRDND